MATRSRSLARDHDPRKEKEDMSSFSIEQMTQLGKSLRANDWDPEDIRLLGQAGKTRLTEIRDSLRKKDGGENIIAAIEAGKTELWPHDDQKRSHTTGRVILNHLTVTGLLAGCANLAELKAIQAKGVEFFRKHFAGKFVFGWRGVHDGRVPYLYEDGDRVFLSWYHLDFDWNSNDPALRRK